MQIKSKEQENIYTISNKFGNLLINLEHKIHLSHGLIGLSQYKDFCITSTELPNLQRFQVLQSLNDNNLAFLVLPLEMDNPLIALEDLKAACKHTQVQQEGSCILLIASTTMIDEQKVITVNTKAPVILDVTNKLAIQYVLHQDYPTQFIIS